MSRIANMALAQGMQTGEALRKAIAQALSHLEAGRTVLRRMERDPQADSEDHETIQRVRYDLDRMEAEYNL